MMRLPARCSFLRKVQHVRGIIIEGNNSLTDAFLKQLGLPLSEGPQCRSWSPRVSEALVWARLAGGGLEAGHLAPHLRDTPE